MSRTTTPPRVCGCDEALHWKTRAEEAEKRARGAELSLKFARQQLGRLIERVDFAMSASGLSDKEAADSILGFYGGAPDQRQSAIQKLLHESEERTDV